MKKNPYLPSQEERPNVHLPACSIDPKLRGQTALVTGGSSGIGEAIAIALGRAGANVVVNYLFDAEEADRVAKAASGCHGGQAITWQADVSREDEVLAMFAGAIEHYGTVDILVANAGIQNDAAFHEMTLAQWQKVIDVNLTGQFLCCREAIREFRRRGVKPEISCAAGKILCVSSVHDVIPWAGHVNYAASKGGVMLMMKSIAQEVAPHRVRVNSICPGAIKTAINKGSAWGTPELEREVCELIPYNRLGEPDDIGRVAVWLASDDADYITGTNIYVDGGMTLYPGFQEGG